MKLSSFSFLENILLQHFKSRQRIGVNFVKGPKNFFLPPLSPKVSGIPETARLSVPLSMSHFLLGLFCFSFIKRTNRRKCWKKNSIKVTMKPILHFPSTDERYNIKKAGSFLLFRPAAALSFLRLRPTSIPQRKPTQKAPGNILRRAPCVYISSFTCQATAILHTRVTINPSTISSAINRQTILVNLPRFITYATGLKALTASSSLITLWLSIQACICS